MDEDGLLRIARERGFSCIDDFVVANAHYLRVERKQLLYEVMGGKGGGCGEGYD